MPYGEIPLCFMSHPVRVSSKGSGACEAIDPFVMDSSLQDLGRLGQRVISQLGCLYSWDVARDIQSIYIYILWIYISLCIYVVCIYAHIYVYNII